jgi:hypothetical protein
MIKRFKASFARIQSGCMMKGYIPFLAVGKLFSIDENDQMMKE